jgi:hypothetical protein
MSHAMPIPIITSHHAYVNVFPEVNIKPRPHSLEVCQVANHVLCNEMPIRIDGKDVARQGGNRGIVRACQDVEDLLHSTPYEPRLAMEIQASTGDLVSLAPGLPNLGADL